MESFKPRRGHTKFQHRPHANGLTKHSMIILLSQTELITVNSQRKQTSNIIYRKHLPTRFLTN